MKEKNRECPPCLIYDGECPLCRNAVAWVRARCEPGTFEYLSCHAEELTRRFPQVSRSACLAAMHLILPDGRVLAGEGAVPEILLRLRRYRRVAPLFRLPGARFVSGLFYRWFAARRHFVSRLLHTGDP